MLSLPVPALAWTAPLLSLLDEFLLQAVGFARRPAAVALLRGKFLADVDCRCRVAMSGSRQNLWALSSVVLPPLCRAVVLGRDINAYTYQTNAIICLIYCTITSLQ